MFSLFSPVTHTVSLGYLCFNFTGTTIRAISLHRKALSEVDIVNRISRKAQRAFSDYFELILACEVVDS